MKIQVLGVPYDSGRRSFRMGRGPEELIQHGLIGRLVGQGHQVELHEILIDEPAVPSDIGSALAIDKLLAERVRRAIAHEALPLVLAGNCNTAVGTLAGIGVERAGVVWFDCHGDLNTPETTSSGFLDGMALSMVAGRCWVRVARTIPGWAPIPEDRIALVAARDFDPPEAEFLQSSAIAHVSSEAIRVRGVDPTVGPVLDALAERVAVVYVHLDLDVIDPEEAVVNGYQAPGGISTEAVARAVRLIAARRPIAGVALTAYDPAAAGDDRALQVALCLTEAIVDACV